LTYLQISFTAREATKLATKLL